MTKKNKTVTLALCILLGYLGVHRFYTGKTKSGVLYLLTVGLCGIGWIIDIILICTDKFSGVDTPQNIVTPQAVQTALPQPVPIPQSDKKQSEPITFAPMPQSVQTQIPQPQTTSAYKPMPCFLPISDGNGLKYEYVNDLCMIDTNAAELNAELGGMISFKQEPENTSDNKAVSIWQNDRKLGYIYRGQTQEMANRWINNADPFLGFISSIDISQNKIKYKIGFYKPLDTMRKEKFKLIGIRQKDALGDLRQDNLEYCSVGEALTIELDDDDENERYIVWGNSGEIGMLPNNAEDFLGSKRKAIGILTKAECDEDNNYTAEVEVYV